MGASGWEYDVVFEEDISGALEKLRQKVFDDGNYYNPIEEMCQLMRREYSKPRSIAELFSPRDPDFQEAIGFGGTGSILDVTDISENPRHGCMSPISAATLVEKTGSDKPCAQHVDILRNWVYENCERGLGYYFVVYTNDVPTNIYFVGVSGD